MIKIVRNILIGFVLCVMTCSCVYAQEALKFGVVDSIKVLSEAPRFKQYEENLQTFYKDLETKLNVRSQHLMLTETEVTELITLRTKAELNNQEKARSAELSQFEKDRDGELKNLQSTAEPNDQQKTRLKELQDIQQKSKDTGKALATDYESQLVTRKHELDLQVEKDIIEVVTNIANQQGLSMVFLKNSVVFGGTDITDAVIAALDRKAQ